MIVIKSLGEWEKRNEPTSRKAMPNMSWGDFHFTTGSSEVPEQCGTYSEVLCSRAGDDLTAPIYTRRHVSYKS